MKMSIFETYAIGNTLFEISHIFETKYNVISCLRK